MGLLCCFSGGAKPVEGEEDQARDRARPREAAGATPSPRQPPKPPAATRFASVTEVECHSYASATGKFGCFNEDYACERFPTRRWLRQGLVSVLLWACGRTQFRK